MRYFIFIIVTFLIVEAKGQELTDTDYEILRAVSCNFEETNLKIESVCRYSIRSFDFYQDSISYLKDNPPPPSDRIRLGLSPIVEYYDEVPFLTISEYIEIDTTKINKFFNFDAGTESEHWEGNEKNSSYLKIKDSERFNKLTYKFFSPLKDIFVANKFILFSRPIYLNFSQYAIIQKIELNIRWKRVKKYHKTIIFLKMEDGIWSIKETFTYKS